MTDTVDRTPWAGQAYRARPHGFTITSCDSEPVQIPGCIQAHGVLPVLGLSDLVILRVTLPDLKRGMR